MILVLFYVDVVIVDVIINGFNCHIVGINIDWFVVVSALWEEIFVGMVFPYCHPLHHNVQ